MIGLCAAMQRISWADELEYIQTVPFSISARHACLGQAKLGPPLQHIPIGELMKLHNHMAFYDSYVNTVRNPRLLASSEEITPALLPGENEEHQLSSTQRYSFICNELIRRILNGNVAALKELYVHSLDEHPSLIRTIDEVQGCLTSVEIEGDREGAYGDEFLYYFAMVCCGETSALIRKDLSTATTCLEKIEDRVPLAKARLAYIELLRTTSPTSDPANIARIDVLRKWGAMGDMFSQVILARILFYEFLKENLDSEDPMQEVPLRAMRLLETPCNERYPFAVQFLYRMASFMAESKDQILDSLMPVSYSGGVRVETWPNYYPRLLLDFPKRTKMQI